MFPVPVRRGRTGRSPLIRADSALCEIYLLFSNVLESVRVSGEKLKGRLLIIIMRPVASLTHCYGL